MHVVYVFRAREGGSNNTVEHKTIVTILSLENR